MNVVISSAGLDWRGTETVAVDLARGLRQRGHNVTLFGRPDSELARREEIVPVLGAADMNPLTIWRAARALRAHRTDVVFVVKDKDLRQTGIAAKLLGIPVVVLHGTDRPLKNKARYRFFFKKIATHHVANSEATKKTIYESAPWMKGIDIPVIYNGIDVDSFANAQPAHLLTAGPPDRLTAVGFVGHFEYRKGIEDYAQAMKQVIAAVPNTHAIIVGSGGKEADFRILLEGTPNIHWLGFRKDIGSIFKALDIFVMPSHFEGFGLVLAEAMAAGTACIVYDTSSLPELVTDEKTGLLVKALDVDGLAHAIMRLCRDEDLRKQLGKNAALEARTRFSVDAMVHGYDELLAHIGVSRRR